VGPALDEVAVVGLRHRRRRVGVVLAEDPCDEARVRAQGDAEGYDAWAGIFVPVWMKIVTLVALAALFYHAWIGVRDVWMDYVKPTGVRLTLQTLTVLWLLFCAVWAVQILWRV